MIVTLHIVSACHILPFKNLSVALISIFKKLSSRYFCCFCRVIPSCYWILMRIWGYHYGKSEVKGSDAMIFIFWVLSFKPTFSLSSFTCIKRLYSSSSLSTIRVMSSEYLRLLIFLPAILIPACVSSSPAFLMVYSAYKLNKQGDNIQPRHTPFPILEPVCCSMSSSNCCFLTCIQTSQEAGQVVWYSHLFQNFPVYCEILGTFYVL